MYKGYDVKNLESEILDRQIDKLLETSIWDSQMKEFLADKEAKIHKELEDFYLKDGVLDGDLLQRTWFPFLERSHIFLSHSHKDKKFADTFAYLCSAIDVNVFIDSQVWGYADDLLRKLDNEYAYSEETDTYHYSVRNRTTSNVHLMLQNSLNSMIDKSECLLFLNTSNSIEEFDDVSKISQRTSSPWIMSELQFSSMVRLREHPMANRSFHLFKEAKIKAESASNAIEFKVSHIAQTEHLTSIQALDLWDWLTHCFTQELKGFDALTALYNSKYPKSELRSYAEQGL